MSRVVLTVLESVTYTIVPTIKTKKLKIENLKIMDGLIIMIVSDIGAKF